MIAMRDDILEAGDLFWNGKMWVRSIASAKRYPDRESLIFAMQGFRVTIIQGA